MSHEKSVKDKVKDFESKKENRKPGQDDKIVKENKVD